MSHEAYEASLVVSGISLKEFFSDSAIAFPIVECQAKFFRPMFCGDELQVILTPTPINSSEFSITYDFVMDPEQGTGDRPKNKTAQAFTRHVAIHPTQRQRVDLPTSILKWLNHWSGLDDNTSPKPLQD